MLITHPVCMVQHSFVAQLSCQRGETRPQVALFHSLKELVRVIEPGSQARGWFAEAIHQKSLGKDG